LKNKEIVEEIKERVVIAYHNAAINDVYNDIEMELLDLLKTVDKKNYDNHIEDIKKQLENK